MSRRRGTPNNLVKLTNVAVVRLSKQGHRFEVACYPSKVVDYRSGKERDLDEVLQVRSVFSNVSKGVLAPAKEVRRAFGQDDPLLEILQNGELQVSERERATQLESLFRDVAAIVADKTVDARTGRPPPVASIERYMRDDLHFGVAASKSAKQQALEVIKRLEAIDGFGISRAPMRLRLNIKDHDDEQHAALVRLGARFSSSSSDFLLEPRLYTQAIEIAPDIEILERAARGDDLSTLRNELSSSSSNNNNNKARDGGGGDDDARRRRRPQGDESQPRKATTAATRTPATGGKVLTCTTCGGAFADASQHRQHFKSEWHRLNLRRKLENAPPVSELEFQQLQLDL